MAGLVRFAVSLLFVCSLSAQTRSIILDPPGPTSATPVEAHLYVACDPVSHTLERLGNVIKIHVTTGDFEFRCDPPVAVQYRVPLGALPAGEYRIDVGVGERDDVRSHTFVVRNGEESVIDIHPFAVPVQPFGLQLRLAAGELNVAKIFIDEAEVPQASIVYDGAYRFPAPAHARGLVDVKIETNTGATHTLTGGLYYFDRATPLDPSVFERILFPVLVNTTGAHGSQWVSEAAIANPRPWFIETWNEVLPFECIDYPCGERFAPESYVAFSGDGYPRGIALITPRAESENLAFSLRVRDTSRAAEGYGTQVPVVREKDMFRGGELTLLDIPIDPRYRTKLRMYVFDSGEHDAWVTVDRAGSGPADSFFVPVRRHCAGSACEAIPWYAELDLPAGEADERVNVYVTIGAHESPAWAFASVTNNETQQVTIVTADGEGGRP